MINTLETLIRENQNRIIFGLIALMEREDQRIDELQYDLDHPTKYQTDEDRRSNQFDIDDAKQEKEYLDTLIKKLLKELK